MQSEQSGGGPAETKPETQPEESKKKGKKNKKKNRRKPAETAKPINKPEPTPKPEDLIVDDVEEVILPDETVQTTVKLDKSVLRNNFLTEDPPAKTKQAVTVSSAIVIEPEYDGGVEKEEA